MELICANGKQDSGTKFNSPEFCLAFAHENGEQPLFIKMLSNSPFDLQGKTRQIDPVKR